MKKFLEKLDKYITRSVLIIVVLALSGTLLYATYELHKAWRLVSFHNVRSIQLKTDLDITKTYLTETELERAGLQSDLEYEQERVNSFAEKFEEVADTVVVLDKLSKTDKELLQKYSKVYFLNEHYVPNAFTEIQTTHTYSNFNTELVHAKVFPYLIEMLDDAASDGTPIYVKSGYRSFGEQSELKATYRVTFGEGANTFAADQGYSEHQLGTTVDLIGPGSGGILDERFANTSQYEWLLENAHNYGFILSYPQGNAYYVFEPWHWRFVGIDLATSLHNKGINFYDESQREIDKYLVDFFE